MNNNSKYASEIAFFDDVAEKKPVKPIDPADLEDIGNSRHPDLFAEHFVKNRMGDLKGKKVLEIGCGNGVGSVYLAHFGAAVHALDISPRSIENARELARLHKVDISFEVADVTTIDGFEKIGYDIVWCDLCLHHLINDLDALMDKFRKALKPQGLFIAREPVAYPAWLKTIRKAMGPIVPYEHSPGEQPLRDQEFSIIRKHFPSLDKKYFRISARIDVLHPPRYVFEFAARIDSMLLLLPGVHRFAGNAVLWAYKN
jgi:2-polyprenyl-3-methyl-5-hydroxy-6-metoxy-1,4-benzoquinol methylase